MRESQVQRRFLEKLDDLGIYYVRVIMASKAGCPDVIACFPGGKFVGLEFKGSGGKLSPLQKYNFEKIIKSGGVPIMVDEQFSIEEVFNV